MPPPPPDSGARESARVLKRQDSRLSRLSRTSRCTGTAFAADAEDEEPQEPQESQKQKPADLAEWMNHLDAKLDAVLELVAKSSHERPKLSRQHSRATLRSSRMSVDSGGTSRSPRRTMMQELLERGRRAVSEEAAETAMERASAAGPTPPCEGRGAGRGRRCDDDDDEVRQPHTHAHDDDDDDEVRKPDKQAHDDEDTHLSPKSTVSSSIRQKSEAAAAAAQAEHARRFRENTAQLNSKLQKRVTSIRNRSTRSSSSLELIMAVKWRVGTAKHGTVRTVVTSPRFDTCVTALIVCNALLIGVQVQNHATSSTSPPWFGYMGHAFTGLFTAELLARMYVHRLEFFSSPTEGSWNLFDMFLVLTSWVDVCLVLISVDALPDSTTFISKLGRTIRIVRILRIIRTVRFCNQLRIILKQLVSSLHSLLWVFVILAAMIYAVAIIITQNAVDYLIIEAPLDSDIIDARPLRQCFGNLFDTMYTLFQCISGGRSWGEVSILMRGPGWVSESLIIVYIFFSVFAVANIVNGVFVDGAIELAKRDRMNMIDKQNRENADKERHLVDLLVAIDIDGDDMISYDEWLLALERNEIREYIAALQVDTVDSKSLFKLLDADGSGNVNVGEFVSGMMALQGDAKSIDVHMLLYENKRIVSMMCGMMDFVYEHFGGAVSEPEPTTPIEV